jgi:hypothetical protein
MIRLRNEVVGHRPFSEPHLLGSQFLKCDLREHMRQKSKTLNQMSYLETYRICYTTMYFIPLKLRFGLTMRNLTR